jgi:hypothetical protein
VGEISVSITRWLAQVVAARAQMVVAAIVLVPMAFVLLRWQPLRQLLRQTREDRRTSHGLPPQATDVAQSNRRPIALVVAGMVVPSVVFAALLAGPIAAGVAAMVGLAARVALAVFVVGLAKD